MGDDGGDGGDPMPKEGFDDWARGLCGLMTATVLSTDAAAEPATWTEEEKALADARAAAALGARNMTITMLPRNSGNPTSVGASPGVKRPVPPAEPRDAPASVPTANVRPRYASLYTYRYAYQALTFPSSALPCLPASRTTSSKCTRRRF
jgi:hypothetical protein